MRKIERPRPLPPKPIAKPLLGESQQVAYARMSAENAEAVASNRLATDNGDYGADADRYDADNANWTELKGGMTQADFNACFSALQHAHEQLTGEHDELGAAYEFIAAGQADMVSAANATTDAAKIQFYNQAKQAFDAAVSCCQNAETKHGAFDGYADQAEEILRRYE